MRKIVTIIIATMFLAGCQPDFNQDPRVAKVIESVAKACKFLAEAGPIITIFSKRIPFLSTVNAVTDQICKERKKQRAQIRKGKNKAAVGFPVVGGVEVVGKDL